MDNHSSFIEYFKNNYLNIKNNLNILEVGYSSEKNSSSLFSESNLSYYSLDYIDGNKVDYYVEDIYNWQNMNPRSFDAVISYNFINKLKFFWLSLNQIEKVLKPGGYLCIVVPSFSHDNKGELYKFSEDSIRSLAEYINFNIVEIKENQSELCLIATKKDEEIFLLQDSYEKEAFRLRYENIIEKYELELNNIKKHNLDLNDSFREMKSLFLDLGENNQVFCPICKTNHDIFSPFGVSRRLNAQCPNCGSLERHRFIYIFLKNFTDIFVKKSKLMQYNPVNSFYSLFKNMQNVDYCAVGQSLSATVDEIIDLEDINYPDNTFDAILNVHVLDKVKDDKKVMKEFYRIVKPFEEGGFVLISVPLLREMTVEVNESNRFRVYGSDIKNRLESVGFKVNEYNSEDIVDEKLMKMCSILPDKLYFCMK